jgi:hypothetical protein
MYKFNNKWEILNWGRFSAAAVDVEQHRKNLLEVSKVKYEKYEVWKILITSERPHYPQCHLKLSVVKYQDCFFIIILLCEPNLRTIM